MRPCRTFARFSIVALALVSVLACTDDSALDEDGGSESADTSSDVGENVPWDGVSEPRWSDQVVPFFYDSCGAGVNGCHSREAFAANFDQSCRGWLSLENTPLGSEIYAPADVAGTATNCPDMGLRERLVSLAPWQCDENSAYVDTQNIQQSYLLRKMRGVDMCEVEGEVMQQMPPPNSGLEITQTDIDMIEAWIEAGAPQDT